MGRKEETSMDTTTIVRIVAGILAVAVLAFVIYRRKHAKA
jgi:LPXTG-motif cell wall-anchored protein